MKTNKISFCLVAILFLIAFVPLASALDFDDKLEFKKDHTTSKWGKYEVFNSNFLIFKGERLATYELLENSYSPIKGWAIIETEIFTDEQLLSDLNLYKGKNGIKTSLKKLDITYEDTEINIIIFPESEEVCEEIILGNGSIERTCHMNQIGTKEVSQEKKVWKVYNGEVLPAGKYKIRIEGTRDNYDVRNIDWILTTGAGKKNLVEWAIWWDTDWATRYSANFTGIDNNEPWLGSNLSITGISFDSDNRSQELRLICDDIPVPVKIDGNTSTTTNITITTNQSWVECFWYSNNPAAPAPNYDRIGGEFFDDENSTAFLSRLDSNNANDTANDNGATITGATAQPASSCVFGTCYHFDGVDDKITYAANPAYNALTSGDDNFCFKGWINWTKTAAGAGRIISQDTGSAGTQDWFMLGNPDTVDYKSRFQNVQGGGIATDSLAGYFDLSNWSYYKICQNSTARSFWKNGVLNNAGARNAMASSNIALNLGAAADFANDLSADLDEFTLVYGYDNGTMNTLATHTLGPEESQAALLPYFSTIPDNSTINYTQGIGVDFVGVNVDTYFLTNWTDTFQINQSGWLENSSSNLAVGTYTINVSINNTDNIINSTIYKVIVNQAVPSGILTGTSPIEYPLAGDVEGTESNSGDGGCSYDLLRDLVSVSNPDTTILGAGTFNYIYNVSTCANWTANASLDTFELTVNKNTSLTLGLTGSTPVEYPATTDFTTSNCPTQLTCTLNLTNQEFTAGVVNGNYSTSGNANYSATSSVFAITINKNSSTTLGITGTTPITYGTITDVATSGCPSQLTCTLDKSNAVFSAGTQLFNYSTPGNINYTATSSVINITINKDVPIGSLTSDLGWTINESQEVTIGYSESNTGDDDLTYLVYRDDSSKGSGETWTPSVGTYYYVLNTTGGQNWTENISMDTQTLTVNDLVYPLISIPSPSNNSNFTTAVVTINISIIEANPGTCIWTNNSYTTNQTFTCGNNITETWEQGNNNIGVWLNDSSGNENRTSVSFFVDSINPVMTLDSPASNDNFYSNESLSLNYSATDTNLANCWYSIDNVINITLPNCLNSTFSTSEGSHNITLYGNDTLGNLGSDTNKFTVIFPTINLISPVDNFQSDNFDVEFNCNFSLAKSIKNVSIFTNSSGIFKPNQTFNVLDGYGSEYYLIIRADTLNISDLEINSVTVNKVNSLEWKINTTNTDDEVSRALIMKTLFYGTDGTDPRINSTYITNLVSISSTDTRDVGKRGTLVDFTANLNVGGLSYTGTFSDTTNNLNSSIWSRVRAAWVGAQGGTLTVQAEFPDNTVVNSVSATGNTDNTVDELGTDRSADEQENPPDVQIQTSLPGAGSLTEEADLIILHSGNISWVSLGTSIINQVDFTLNYSIPEFTFEGNKTFVDAIWNISITEPTLWSCQACDIDDDCFLTSENRTVLLNITSPQINLDAPSGAIDYHIINNNLTINWTVSDSNLESCWFDYNSINTTVTCSANSYSFTPINGFNNLTLYANDTLGNENSNFTSWTYKILQNSVDFNTSVVETTNEGFVLNVTSDGTQTVLATLNYNGTDYVSTKIGDNTNMLFTNNLDIPTTVSGNVSFYWKINYGVETINTDTYQQTINPLQLGICNSTLNVPYINFTFKDEESLTALNSTMEVSNWRYYIGDGSQYREFTFQNTSENPSYAFCFSPSYETFSSTETSFRYSASGYPQRIFTSSSDLSNTTTNALLYLLATADGSYVTIITQNAYGTPIQDVNIIVERQFSGVYTTIGQDETDSSGGSTFWLNPDYDHRFTLSKSGLATQVLTFRPTASSYTVVFGETNTSEAEYTSSVKGVDYSISPLGYTILNQSQLYEFKFIVSANQSNLVSYLFNITDFDGNLLGSDGGSISTGGDNSILLNTGENKSFHAYYFIDTGGGLIQVTRNDYSIVFVNASSLSLITVINDWDIDNQNKDEQFGYFFWAFFLIFLLLAALTKSTNADIVQSGTVLLLISSGAFILSLANFFTITFSPSDFLNQFGIAAIVILSAMGYIIGQVNRT